MAHYAKLGLDNIVLEVLYMDNSLNETEGGIEKESLGVAHLKSTHGHDTWKKCSYQTSEGVHSGGGTAFRANYPGIGWYYNSEHDIFHPARPDDKDDEPCTSWTLNTTTGLWEPPFAAPALTDDDLTNRKTYVWDESAYQADNTEGWVKVSVND